MKRHKIKVGDKFTIYKLEDAGVVLGVSYLNGGIDEKTFAKELYDYITALTVHVEKVSLFTVWARACWDSPSYETRKFTKRVFRFYTETIHSVQEAHDFLYNEFLRERKATHELFENFDKLHDRDN